MKLNIPDIEKRGITEEDLMQVIVYAEESKDKLVSKDETQFLAKKRIDNFTVYAQYSIDGDTANISDFYSHRVNLKKEL